MNKPYDFGIVIGRFQPFHSAHQKLIEHSLSLAEKVIVILGSARSASDVKNIQFEGLICDLFGNI